MKKKIVKFALIGGAVVVALVVVVLAVVYMQRNAIVKKAIEEVGTYVVMAPVTVEKVKLEPLRGEVELFGLHVGNPEGYKTKEAMSVGRVHVKVDMQSLGSDVMRINLIQVEEPHITVEQGFSSSNLKQLGENAQRLSSGEEEPATEEEQKAESKMVIDKILVTNAKVGMSAPVLQGKQLDIPLPKVEMNDFGKESEPITTADAINRFIKELYGAILGAGKGIIPDDLMGTMTAGLDTLKSGVGSATGAVTDTAGDAGKAVTEGVEKTGEALKEGAGAVTEGVKGLFGGKKDDNK